MRKIEKILAYLFPVKMPRIDLTYVQGGDAPQMLEDGIGVPKIKPYKDAIDRYWQTVKER